MRLRPGLFCMKGKSMDQSAKTLDQAIRMAMDAEQKAASFYESAAAATKDPRGKDMLSQLSAFEKKHVEILSRMLKPEFAESAIAPFPSFSLNPVQLGVPSAPLAGDALKTDLDALTIAIESEKRARKTYLNLADSSESPRLKNIFLKIADEEDLHRKILEDQFMGLTNKGYWTWGE